MIKILLAEDHTIVRNGVRTILEAEEDMEVLGEATNGYEALDLLNEGVGPDVILTDISMPEMDGLELARRVKAQHPCVKVIVLSMLNNEKYVFEAFHAGVDGYLLKNADADEMKVGIRQVASGKGFICSEIGMRLLQKAMATYSKSSHVMSKLQLSTREREILQFIAEGYTNNEIADKIFASKRTIEGYRLNLIEKAGVKNTAQLISYAVREGVV